MVETLLAVRLILALIKQDECAVAVFVHDLDASVLNQLVVEGLNAEIHRAHRAGELREMIILALSLGRDVHEVIEAAEHTAAHLHIRGVDRNRHGI